MTISKIIPLLATLVFFITSCSPKLTTFSERIYDAGDWSERDLKDIQFYVSDHIILRRQLTSGKSKIEDGEIKVINGRKVEEVIIKKGTPGVFMSREDNDRLAVSFESGKNKNLLFGANAKRGGNYALLAKWEDRNSGKVKYAGKNWRVILNGEIPMLQVDLKKNTKTTRKSRVAKGRKVN